jgi:hypothetical protein
MVELGGNEDMGPVLQWLEEENIRVLNVAGPRESKNPGITRIAARYVVRLLKG